MAKRLTQAALARQLGLSQPEISALAARGMPTTSARAARKWRLENLDQSRVKDSTASAATAASRLQHLVARTKLREMEVAALEDALLDRGEVVDSLAKIEQRMACELAATTDRVVEGFDGDEQVRARLRQRLAEEFGLLLHHEFSAKRLAPKKTGGPK